MHALPLALSALAALLLAPSALRFLADEGRVRENYRGRTLPFPGGLAIVAAVVVALVALAALRELSQRRRQVEQHLLQAALDTRGKVRVLLRPLFARGAGRRDLGPVDAAGDEPAVLRGAHDLPQQIEMAARLRAPVIEIHTGGWCDAVVDGHTAKA